MLFVNFTHLFQSPGVVLKLRKPDNAKKVKWEEGTVDNEHLDKKKSKCKLLGNITLFTNITSVRLSVYFITVHLAYYLAP